MGRINMKIKLIALVVVIALLLFVLIYSNFLVADSANSFIGLGEQCPEFTVDTYEDDIDSYSVTDSRGKVTVINFWATWCGPCVKELPHFETLLNNYSDRVEVVAVHSDSITEDVVNYIENKANWGDYNIIFAQDKQMEFTVTAEEDGETVTSTVTSNLFKMLGGGDALPMTVILDADGVIQYRRQGSITYSALEKQVRQIMLGLHVH